MEDGKIRIRADGDREIVLDGGGGIPEMAENVTIMKDGVPVALDTLGEGDEVTVEWTEKTDSEDEKIRIVLESEEGQVPRIEIPRERWEELLPPELREKLTQGCPVCKLGEEEADEIFKNLDSVVLYDVEVVQ